MGLNWEQTSWWLLGLACAGGAVDPEAAASLDADAAAELEFGDAAEALDTPEDDPAPLL